MKPTSFLNLIYSAFLGIAVVAFVAIAVNTFYPTPRFDMEAPDPDWPARYWLTTSAIVLVAATFVMVISLVWPRGQAVLADGFLLGGPFTMIYAMGMSLGSTTSWWRLVVAAVALVITVVTGWYRFVKRPAGQAAPINPTVTEGAADAGDLDLRLTVLERKISAMTKALDE